jgi:peptidoglycan-associated lipoprotein
MKLPQTLCLVAASAALVLAGCTKKPARPDPSATLGPIGSGTASSALNPMDIATTTPTDMLTARDSTFDANGEDRTSLQGQTVYFDFDSSAIKASERTKLQAAKDYLDKNPGRKLLVEGRCDWRGTAEYNLALGDRRANAAKKYLQSLGVPADRIETRSKGSLEAAKNADDATMKNDRRDDLIVLQGAGAPGALPAAGAPADLSTAPAPAAGGAL